MTEFARDFVSSIEGTSIDVSTKELCGGARIYYIFNDVFGHALTSINPTHNLTLSDVRTAIRNSTGPRPSMFVPEVAFDLLVKPQIKLLEPPSLRCVELVYEELMKICHNCTSPELQRFPKLHAQLIEVVSELLRERLGPTSEYVSSLIQIQAAYINTNHPDFQAGSAAIAQQGAQAQLQPQKAPSLDGSASDDDTSSESSASVVNGTSPHHVPHSSTTSVPDARAPAASKILESTKKHGRGFSSSGAPSPVPAMPHMGASPHNAKESFLNYFFGGPNGMPVDSSSAPGSSHGHHVRPRVVERSNPSHHGSSAHEFLPDLNSGRRTASSGLDPGSATAYDMKSLGKHLDGDDHMDLSPREQMETNLILSLIASYFNIVRQTIEDLIPKAIMHLLVNFSRDAIQQRLVTQLYKPDLFEQLLHEDEALVSERGRVKALLDAYNEAFRVLSEVSLKST